MSRIATSAVVAGLAVLVLAALVDALVGRDGGEGTTAARTDATTTIPAGALAEAGVTGRLLYTDAADCTLRGLSLPALEPAPAPDWDTCGFALGPAGAVAPEGTVFEPSSGLRAEAFGGGVDVVDPATRLGRRIENARAPAFRPDGTLTLVRRGALRSLPACPGRGPAVTRIGRCRSAIVTEERLTALAPLSVDPRPLRLAIVETAWLDDVRVVLLVDAGAGDALLGMDTDGAVPRVEVWLEDERLSGLLVNARRGLASVVTSTGELAVLDAEGVLLGLRGSRVRASAWSPDGRWLALLDGDGVLFVDGRTGEDIGPVALSARDLGWD